MMRRTTAIGLAWIFVLATAAAARAADVTAEVRATFEKFVAAQNAHDPAAVEALLLDAEDFLWVTRGAPVWGRAKAMEGFKSLYAGTWHLEPNMKAFRVLNADDRIAQIFVPVRFTIGPPGQPAQRTPFMMNQVLRKEAGVWRIAAILPIMAGMSTPVAGAAKD